MIGLEKRIVVDIPRGKKISDEMARILLQLDKMDDVDIAADGEILKYPKGWIVGNQEFGVIISS